MTLPQTIEQIAQNGLSFVISGVFIYIIVRFVNMGFDKMAKSVNIKEHDKLLAMRGEIDVEVHELISKFLSTHHGTRIQVVEFTNSVMSVAYLPFKYMSCTYEVVSYGNRPEAKRIDKLSTSLFSPFLVELSREAALTLDNQFAQDLSGAVHDIFEGLGSKYQLCAILKSQKDKAIGFVSLGKETDVSTGDVEDIKILASQLSALLGVLDI